MTNYINSRKKVIEELEYQARLRGEVGLDGETVLLDEVKDLLAVKKPKEKKEVSVKCPKCESVYYTNEVKIRPCPICKKEVCPQPSSEECECICHASEAVMGHGFTGYCDECVKKECSYCKVPSKPRIEKVLRTFEDSYKEVKDAIDDLLNSEK